MYRFMFWQRFMGKTLYSFLEYFLCITISSCGRHTVSLSCIFHYVKILEHLGLKWKNILILENILFHQKYTILQEKLSNFTAMHFQSWLPKEARAQVLRAGIEGQELEFCGLWGQSSEAAPQVKTKEESNVSGHIYKELMPYFCIKIKHWTH